MKVLRFPLHPVTLHRHSVPAIHTPTRCCTGHAEPCWHSVITQSPQVTFRLTVDVGYSVGLDKYTMNVSHGGLSLPCRSPLLPVHPVPLLSTWQPHLSFLSLWFCLFLTWLEAYDMQPCQMGSYRIIVMVSQFALARTKTFNI